MLMALPIEGQRARQLLGLILLVISVAPACADREINAAEYLDRLRGMWFGQLIGNHSGRALEGLYQTRDGAPDSEFSWVIKTSESDPWSGDDDTNFEYLYLHTLETFGLEPNAAQIQAHWDAHVTLTGVYIANRQAWYLMDHGYQIPDTGSFRFNMHAYAIDSQITTESLGALAPGMPQWAIDSVRRFGGVSNEGFALHAAQFYAALYAYAAFESDPEVLVELAQNVVPTTSRSWQAIQDVRDWYEADMLDGVPDWRATRQFVYDYYVNYDNGRFRNWVESTINLALTTLAILYGQGEFEDTIRIGVLCGYDADCNPATAGGLIGLVLGYDALPTELTSSAADVYAPEGRPGLPETDTITNIAARLQAITEQVIIAHGGNVVGGIYTIPDFPSPTPDPEMPDPTGPAGLVATIHSCGGTVTTSASIESHIATEDALNLDAIIDGIIDLRYNGHRPYSTYDGENTQPADGDYYQLNFSTPTVCDQLTYYEGDIRWNHINQDPRVLESWGGYFDNLTVEVFRDGEWSTAQNLAFSETLDPYVYYQTIEMTFAPARCDSIRIRGDAGGSREYTTIVELVVAGYRVGDLNDDGNVTLADLQQLLANYGSTTAPTYIDGDLDLDGDIDLADLQELLARYGMPCN